MRRREYVNQLEMLWYLVRVILQLSASIAHFEYGPLTVQLDHIVEQAAKLCKLCTIHLNFPRQTSCPEPSSPSALIGLDNDKLSYPLSPIAEPNRLPLSMNRLWTTTSQPPRPTRRITQLYRPRYHLYRHPRLLPLRPRLTPTHPLCTASTLPRLGRARHLVGRQGARKFLLVILGKQVATE